MLKAKIFFVDSADRSHSQHAMAYRLNALCVMATTFIFKQAIVQCESQEGTWRREALLPQHWSRMLKNSKFQIWNLVRTACKLTFRNRSTKRESGVKGCWRRSGRGRPHANRDRHVGIDESYSVFAYIVQSRRTHRFLRTVWILAVRASCSYMLTVYHRRHQKCNVRNVSNLNWKIMKPWLIQRSAHLKLKLSDSGFDVNRSHEISFTS